MKICVGLSGGVDSAVAALLLRDAGHEVTGVTMKLWREGRYKGGSRDACFGPGEEEDIRRADAICSALGIPYRVFDCSEEYEAEVLAGFRSEYRNGRTPNPCVRCNSTMKFGVLPRLARAAGLEFDRFATGHYGQTGERNGRQYLAAGEDAKKDQSYFLYRLTQEQLRSLLFPLGEMTKAEVRQRADAAGLEVGSQPDSQDFYSGDYTELLGVEQREGNIVDSGGKVLGTHCGYWNYTIGQRKGLGFSAPEPYYVIAINACRNEVVVGKAAEAVSYRLIASDCNWVSIAPPEEPFEASVKVRSAQTAVPCRVEPAPAGFTAAFPAGITAVTPGQSAVLYRDGYVLGGGIIDKGEL